MPHAAANLDYYGDAHLKRVFWITGLSGAGKTTLAQLLLDHLKRQGLHPVMLDGDVIRDLLVESPGHDRETRLRIARFNARLCRFLALQDLTVICPTISMFDEVRAWNREHIPGYVEIFLDVPLEELKRRDPKGIYSGYANGRIRDVVGLDIPAQFPSTPDIHLRHDAASTPESWLAAITDFYPGH